MLQEECITKEGSGGDAEEFAELRARFQVNALLLGFMVRGVDGFTVDGKLMRWVANAAIASLSRQRPDAKEYLASLVKRNPTKAFWTLSRFVEIESYERAIEWMEGLLGRVDGRELGDGGRVRDSSTEGLDADGGTQSNSESLD